MATLRGRLPVALLCALVAWTLLAPGVTAGPVPSAGSPAEATPQPARFPTGCDPPGSAFDPSPDPLTPARFAADAAGHDEVLVRLDSGLEPFDPARLLVDPGTCVVFRNDGPTHTVHVEADTTGNVAVTVEERLHRGETVRILFDREGIYHLHCRTHPVLMHGVLQVR